MKFQKKILTKHIEALNYSNSTCGHANTIPTVHRLELIYIRKKSVHSIKINRSLRTKEMKTPFDNPLRGEQILAYPSRPIACNNMILIVRNNVRNKCF